MTFFFDRCFPRSLTHALQILQRVPSAMKDVVLIHFNDRPEFSQSTPDTEWIRVVSLWNPKPIVITSDPKILKRPDEMRELFHANLMFIALADQWAEMDIWDQAWKFIKLWPNVLKKMDGLHQPTVFSLSGGQVPKLEKLYLTRELPHK
jgi:hypothetical protein